MAQFMFVQSLFLTGTLLHVSGYVAINKVALTKIPRIINKYQSWLFLAFHQFITKAKAL